MTVAEAGRKGGRLVRERHGLDYYKAIGRKGGQKVREALEKAAAFDALDGAEQLRRTVAKARAYDELVRLGVAEPIG